MSLLTHIGANELGALAAILAILLADDLDAVEINTLGNFAVALGSVMLVIAAQKEFLKVQQEKASTKAQQEKDSTKAQQEKDSTKTQQEKDSTESEMIRQLIRRIEELEASTRSANAGVS